MASGFDALRLETQDGTIVAYFAPAFQVTPISRNDLVKTVLPRNRGAQIRDLNKWLWEVTVQGDFEHSDNLPADHKAALEAIFGSLPVTARQQVNRIHHYARITDEGMFLFDAGDEYVALNLGEQDLEAGIFPTVFIDEFRPPRTTGLSRVNFMVKMTVGFER